MIEFQFTRSDYDDLHTQRSIVYFAIPDHAATLPATPCELGCDRACGETHPKCTVGEYIDRLLAPMRTGKAGA